MKNLLAIIFILSSFYLYAQPQLEIEDTNGNTALLRGASMTFDNADNLRKFNFFANTLVDNPLLSLNYQVFSLNGVITNNILNLDGDDARVGIGITSPAVTLHVDRGITPVALFGDTGGSLGFVTINQPMDAASNTQSIFRVRDAGTTKFRVNEGGSTYQVEIAGDARITGVWSNSDRKLKKQISPLRGLLSKIQRLQPKIYQYRYQEEKLKHLGLPKEKQFGLIAQEVQKIFPNLVKSTMEYDESGAELEVMHTINYIGLIPVLLGGIQEQQIVISELKNHIEVQQQAFQAMKAEIMALQAAIKGDTETNSSTSILLKKSALPRMEQNIPNPFHSNTQINYFLPASIQSAQLQITTINGQVLKVIKLEETGEGQVVIDTKDISSGAYYYTLIVDGKPFQSKQMILTK